MQINLSQIAQRAAAIEEGTFVTLHLFGGQEFSGHMQTSSVPGLLVMTMVKGPERYYRTEIDASCVVAIQHHD